MADYHYDGVPAPKTSSYRVSKTTVITLHGTDIEVGEIREILKEIPDDAKLSIAVVRGDQRDPSYATLTVHHA